MRYETTVQNLNGLSEDEMRRFCPSVFATEKHESRSERYTTIPTIRLIEELKTVGFVPITAMQARSRIPGKAAHTTHLIRFCRIQDLGNYLPDMFSIAFRNSFDGSSAYDLWAGWFRMVCSNGLISGDFADQRKVYHRGDVVEGVVEGTLELAEKSDEITDVVAEMKGTLLSRREQLLLAEFALKARYDDNDDEEEGKEEASRKVIPFQPSDLLKLRRFADNGDDAFTVMNKVQENGLEGGVGRYDRQGHHHKMRKVQSIGKNVSFNRLLWQFTERQVAIKNGHYSE